jgi:hypothetical protein
MHTTTTQVPEPGDATRRRFSIGNARMKLHSSIAIALFAQLVMATPVFAQLLDSYTPDTLDGSELNQRIGKKRHQHVGDPYIQLVQSLDPYSFSAQTNSNSPDSISVMAGGFRTSLTSVNSMLALNQSTEKRLSARKTLQNTVGALGILSAGAGSGLVAGGSGSGLGTGSIFGAALLPEIQGARGLATSAAKNGACSFYPSGVKVAGMPSDCN